MFSKITVAEIAATNAINADAKAWAIENLEYLNKPMTILGSSTKVEKGADKFETYILYLQPADKVATKTLCAMAEAAGCKNPCLITSGHLGMTAGQNAATKRTILLLLRRDWFNAQLIKEIAKAERKAAKPGNAPALFRLNGTSDIDWSDIIKACPKSEFYDYSKSLSNVRTDLPNYDVTFSGSMFSQQSKRALKKAVAAKFKIAVAFNTAGAKADTLDIPEDLANFDESDLRNMDAPGTLGALKRKGSNAAERAAENKRADSFFVTEANLAEFNDIIAIG